MLDIIRDSLILLLPLAVICIGVLVLRQQQQQQPLAQEAGGDAGVQPEPQRQGDRDAEPADGANARVLGKKKAKNLEKKELRRRHNEWERERNDERERRRDLLNEERDRAEQEKAKERQKRERLEQAKQQEERRLEQEKQQKLALAEAQKRAVNDVRDEIVALLKERRIVDVKAAANDLNVRHHELRDALVAWSSDGSLLGVLDERGHFVYVDESDVAKLQAVIEQRGLVALTDIKQLLRLDADAVSETRSEASNATTVAP